jgi:hypothetical protein
MKKDSVGTDSGEARPERRKPWASRVENLLAGERNRCAEVCRDLQEDYLDRGFVGKAFALHRAVKRILGEVQ